MPGVVAPRFLPAAQNASVREQAIESIGTYEWQDWTTPGSPLVNTNGHYWSRLADLAWNRDIEIHLDNVPVDLDQDGTIDTHVTRHISLKGGIFANPEVFGLAADPDQPAGTRGYTSASTGFSGLRDALDLETGKPTGDIGMTCWLCHSGRNPVDGKTILGLPSARLDYGLLLATSSFLDPKHVIDLDKDGQPDSEEEIRRRTRLPDSLALDLDHDGRVTVAEYRKALKLPDAQQTLATLLLAGPGRADLTNEFGLDMTVPGLHSRRYSDAGTMRTGAEGVFNPKSIPTALGVRSLSVINWASTYPTRAPDLLGRYVARTEMSRSQAMAELGIDLPAGFEGDFDLINRAMVLDTRSMGAIGLQADSFVGIMLVRVLRHDSPAPPDLVRSLRLAYEASAIRKLLYDTPLDSVTKPVLDAAAVQRGRRLFFDANAGSIINQQILVDVPRAYRDSEVAAALARAHRRDAAFYRAHSRSLRDLPLGDHAEHQAAHSRRGARHPSLHRLPLLPPADRPVRQAGPAQGRRSGWLHLDLRRVRHRAHIRRGQGRALPWLPRSAPGAGPARDLHQLPHPALRCRR